MSTKSKSEKIYYALAINFWGFRSGTKYKASAKYDDLLDVDSIIKSISFASITFSTTIKNSSGKLLVTGDVKLAFINREGKICRIPEEIASQFTE